MWLAYTILFGAVAIQCALSLIAFWRFRNVPRVPMQWNASGQPTWTAPTWIGLTSLPLITFLAMTFVLVVKHAPADVDEAVRGIALTALFAIFAQISHLALLWKHVGEPPRY